MIRNDVMKLADRAEALEDEIRALRTLDPYDPHIPLLQQRLHTAVEDLYATVPRGV